MLGGLDKKATYLNDYRKTQKNLIVVDSGDLLNEHETIKESFMPSAQLKADLIAQVYKGIGIDAINVGELDLALGVDYLKELQKKYDLPFVSANIVDDKNQLLFDPYVIKEVDGLKVGIIGIMGNTSDVAKKMKEIAGSLTVLDPIKTAEARVADLKGKVDYLIVMTHQHIGRNWIIARKIEGVDLVVGGHHKQKLKTPYQANDTYIVQTGEKGQYQGMFEVDMAADGTKTVKNELVPMSDKIASDPKVKAMIDKYNQDVAKLYTTGTTEKEDTAVPKSMECNDCHNEAYEIWTKTDHAKAFQTLINKNMQFNPDCLACHTTRFEEPGGFTVTAQEKELRNVQCDSCHGDSAAHMGDPEVLPEGKAGMETCVKCHTEHRCPDFEKNYAQEWEKIKH
jgi:nitrate/TMAO reductase-like tetraheme cytochrome c subunit